MEDTITIALVVGITMGLIEFIKFGTTKFFDYLNKSTDKGKTDIKQEVNIAVLETKVDLIMTNGLPHIQRKVDSIEKEMIEVRKTQGKIDISLAKICQKLDIE